MHCLVEREESDALAVCTLAGPGYLRQVFWCARRVPVAEAESLITIFIWRPPVRGAEWIRGRRTQLVIQELFNSSRICLCVFEGDFNILTREVFRLVFPQTNI